jgi:hypothetical protein
VIMPCVELGRELVGVLCEPDLDDPIDKSGVGAPAEEFDAKDPAVEDGLLLRCDIGNRDSACFGFLRNRKNVVVVCVV